MSEQKGIATLIRPCATLARYEAALAAGEITSDVMVLIEDVRQIRWRGNIWNFVGKVEVNSVPYARAEGLILSDGTRFYLPSSASDDDPAHTFAMLSDLESAGGGVSEDVIIEDEEVAAVALHDHEARLAELENVVPTDYATKLLLATTREELLQIILEDEEIIATALMDLNNRLMNYEVS